MEYERVFLYIEYYVSTFDSRETFLLVDLLTKGVWNETKQNKKSIERKSYKEINELLHVSTIVKSVK